MTPITDEPDAMRLVSPDPPQDAYVAIGPLLEITGVGIGSTPPARGRHGRAIAKIFELDDGTRYDLVGEGEIGEVWTVRGRTLVPADPAKAPGLWIESAWQPGHPRAHRRQRPRARGACGRGLALTGSRLVRAMNELEAEEAMLREFRDFIIKGNAIDLAIAVILAVAFGAVVVAVTDVLMAFVAAFAGKPDFNALAFDVNGTPIPYGKVITTLINLLLVGGVLFLVVKAINRARRPAQAAPPVETDHDLLAQIRDELRSRPRVPA